jgi:rubrerythrin
MADELVTIATYRFAPKAEMAKVLLEQEGIMAFVADATIVNTDWFLGGAVGHVKLQVPANQVAAASALLRQHAEALDAERANAAEDEDADETCLACGAKMDEANEVCPACGWSYDNVDAEN